MISSRGPQWGFQRVQWRYVWMTSMFTVPLKQLQIDSATKKSMLWYDIFFAGDLEYTDNNAWGNYNAVSDIHPLQINIRILNVLSLSLSAGVRASFVTILLEDTSLYANLHSIVVLCPQLCIPYNQGLLLWLPENTLKSTQSNKVIWLILNLWLNVWLNLWFYGGCMERNV